MKNMISFSLVIMFCLLIFSSCGNMKKEASHEQQREDTLAEEYNFESIGKASKGAISYGMASNSGYILPPEVSNTYIAPTFVKKLPENMEAPEPGPSESVDEIASTTDYYDGSSKLNTVYIKCNIYADPNDCFRQSSCGWCGSRNTCVLGNNIGPLQSCVKSSYIFSAPVPNIKQANSPINTNVSGMNVKIVQDKKEEPKKEEQTKDEPKKDETKKEQ